MKYIVTVNDKSYEVEVERGVAQVLSVAAAASPAPAVAPVAPAVAVAAAPVATAQSATATVAGEVISSPMPGVILSIKATVGDKVKRGDVLLTLEAMKMENEITATKDGTVAQLLAAKGATVSTGTPLVVIQ